MRKVHSVEERLTAVKLYLSGRTAKSLEKEFGIDHNDLVALVKRYQRHGIEGLQHRIPRPRPQKLKDKVCREYMKHSLSLLEIADKYDIDKTTVNSWIRRYKKDMEDKQKAKELKLVTKQSGIRDDENLISQLKRLQEENLDLRAENELLKKMKALVENREARLRGTGSKSSKN